MKKYQKFNTPPFNCLIVNNYLHTIVYLGEKHKVKYKGPEAYEKEAPRIKKKSSLTFYIR